MNALDDIMESECIFQVRRMTSRSFSVRLNDGRVGYGDSFEAALKAAKVSELMRLGAAA